MANYMCGGTLIAENIVLTAAHCTLAYSSDKVVIGGYGSIYYGPDYRQDVIPIKKIIPHPEYGDENKIENDYMVVVLEWESKHQPACIADKDEMLAPGSELRVIGFGHTESGEKGSDSEFLMEANVPYIDNKKCGKLYRGKYIPSNMMCTSSDEGRDACQGDSGGPLIKYGTTDAEDVVVGITSWGWGCGTYPGVYARISKEYDWIKGLVEQNGGQLASCGKKSPMLSSPDVEYKYIGCYRDKSNDRVFSNMVQRRDTTTELCASLCGNFNYFLRQFKGQCFCGDDGYDKHGPSTECDCGGENVGSSVGCVYEYVTRPVTDRPVPAPSSSSSTAPITSPPVRAPVSYPGSNSVRPTSVPIPPPTRNPVFDSGTVSSYNYLGCYRDDKMDRLFSVMPQSRGASTEECAALCKEYFYFFRQFKGQCFCGQGTEDYKRHSKSSECRCEEDNVGSYIGCLYSHLF